MRSTTNRGSLRNIISLAAWSAAVFALALGAACTQNMQVGGALAAAGAGGTDAAATFPCGSKTCVSGSESCRLLSDGSSADCLPLPQGCAGGCACVCDAASDSGGVCTNTGKVNFGQGPCGCQAAPDTNDTTVTCYSVTGAGGAGGAGGAVATGGTSGRTAPPTFSCGNETCTSGTDFCLMGPAVGSAHCMPFPQNCVSGSDFGCGCACQTPNSGPGTCADPAQFNAGGGQCACQFMGATSNVVVWCSAG
jgi:hypothetical protein